MFKIPTLLKTRVPITPLKMPVLLWYSNLLNLLCCHHLAHSLCFVFLTQESVVSNLNSLDALISWVQKRKGGREVVRQAIEALQELFCTVLLPDRKLLHFEQRPLHVSGCCGWCCG